MTATANAPTQQLDDRAFVEHFADHIAPQLDSTLHDALAALFTAQQAVEVSAFYGYGLEATISQELITAAASGIMDLLERLPRCSSGQE